MSIEGIDRVVYGVEDFAACKKFFLDWGLKLKRESPDALELESLNGCQIALRRPDDPALPAAFEPGPTVRELVWGVESKADLDRLRASMAGTAGFKDLGDSLLGRDPNGLGLRFRISQKRKIDAKGVPPNVWGLAPQRIDQPSPVYERAEPVEVGHLVFFTPNLAEVEAYYTSKLGFVISDRYPGRALFLRCAAYGGHHDIFFLQLPNGKRGLNHVAFTVRDMHEVFGGGLHVSRCGWETEIGPGRHPTSSAYFWYVKCPAGGLAEYFTDEDMLTPAWQPRDIEFKPENFAEWGVIGGIDGHSRRQKSGPASEAQHMAGQAVRK